MTQPGRGRPPGPTAHETGRVYGVIRNAEGRPLSRLEISERTGLHDRVVRECVSHLVSRGEPIITDRHSGGYEYTRDPARLEVEYRRLMSHATHILSRAEALKRHLARQADLFPEAVSA